jgi:hypothetical protein
VGILLPKCEKWFRRRVQAVKSIREVSVVVQVEAVVRVVALGELD